MKRSLRYYFNYGFSNYFMIFAYLLPTYYIGKFLMILPSKKLLEIDLFRRCFVRMWWWYVVMRGETEKKNKYNWLSPKKTIFVKSFFHEIFSWNWFFTKISIFFFGVLTQFFIIFWCSPYLVITTTYVLLLCLCKIVRQLIKHQQ